MATPNLRVNTNTAKVLETYHNITHYSVLLPKLGKVVRFHRGFGMR